MAGLRIQVLQHVPFEGVGSIQDWAEARGASLSTKRLFEPGALPMPDGFDWLIVMGGPMSVNDGSRHPWLDSEKLLIEHAMEAGKTVVGICLGAQLIANALGARVFPNPHKEIGWFPVRPSSGAGGRIADLFGREKEVFHWHGETFDLPPRAVGFLESEACRNQAFVIDRKVLGLQFHLETTPQGAALMVENSREELVPGPFVQTEAKMLARPERFATTNRLMYSMLDELAS